jgi:hypothetical protein
MHLNRNQQPPPQESGKRLLRCPRGGDEQLRLYLASYEGRPFVDARIWARAEGGRWVPTKRGCSFRMRELDAIVEALGWVRDMAPTTAENPSHRERGLPLASPGFDEFSAMP